MALYLDLYFRLGNQVRASYASSAGDTMNLQSPQALREAPRTGRNRPRSAIEHDGHIAGNHEYAHQNDEHAEDSANLLRAESLC